MSTTIEKQQVSAHRIVRNFLIMSMAFALNHGTVTALIALASSDLGSALGNASSSILYVCYTIVAAFFSHYTTANLGSKRTLVFGLSVYCLYVASYLIAYLIPSLQWFAICIGACLGGIGAGVLWPAQGAYYSQAAQLLAELGQKERHETNAMLGGYFASCYLSGEVAMKLLSSIIPTYTGNAGIKILFIFFTIVACASAFAMSFVDDLQKIKTINQEQLEDKSLGATAFSAIKLLLKDPKCTLMIPFNFAFGLGASYINGYFFSAVVSNELSTNAIGYISATVVLSAAIFAMPLSRLGAILEQAPVVAFGAICIFIFAIINLIFSSASLGSWPIIIAMAILFGAGRSTWEGNFKATFADYFPNDVKAAFANVQLQSGLATALGFILVLAAPPVVVGCCVAGTCILAVFAQLLAHRLYKASILRNDDPLLFHEHEPPRPLQRNNDDSDII
mmetsp:Transcript_19058/g.24701  ORF Transcript_19058/g.24701 Transcript_19058/m.24701 type:complete len:450 (+) Transcript_19058:61-1410(+)